MAKLSAWLVTLIGVLWLVGPLGMSWITGAWVSIVIGLAFLVMGIGKLIRNYSGKRR